MCLCDSDACSQHLMLACASLSFLVHHQPALERRVLTEANVLQLLRLATQKGAYLDDDLQSRHWTRWASQAVLRNLLSLETVQSLPSVQQLLQQFCEKWMGRIEALAAKCANQAISYAGGLEVLNAVLEGLSQSDVHVLDLHTLPARTLASLSDLCALPETQSGMPKAPVHLRWRRMRLACD